MDVQYLPADDASASRRRWRLAAVAIVAAVGAGGVCASAVQAAMLTVTTTGDPIGNSQCSLREAIAAINAFGTPTVCGTADSSGNTIVLGPHPYTLLIGPSGADDNSTGDLDLTANIPTTIEGAGVDQTSITGAALPAVNPDRLFHVIAGTVTFRGLTLTHGTGPNGAEGMDGVNGMSPAPPTDGMPGFNGGAIFNGANLTLTDVAVTNNIAGNGGKGGVGETLDTGANGGPGGVGGGIYNVGTLSLTDVTMSANHAGNGGAGGAGGAGGSAGGGGMGGCCGDGGGLDSAAGMVVIVGSTFAGNHAGNGGGGGDGGASVGASGTSGSGGTGAGGSSGGGIAVTGGSAMITNSTSTANVSGLGGDGGDAPGGGQQGVGSGGNAGNGGAGGGLFVKGGATVTLLNVTVAGNQVSVAGIPGVSFTGGSSGAAGNPPFGGGVYTNGTPATNMTDTLLAGNGLGNCAGSTTDGGHNLSFGDASCPTTFAGGDPKLGTLEDNGGPTPTMALGAGSAAIDSGAGCGSTDQRGVLRPVGAACDIGAYEFALPGVSTGSPSAVTPTSALLNGSVTANNASAGVVFEFGETTAYGSHAPATAVTGLQSAPVAARLTGLAPDTTYHYRLVATSSDGSATSSDAVFTTASAPGVTNETPELTRLSIAPSRFFAATSRHHNTGTTITYTDSLAARTTIVVFEQTPGVKLHGRCVKPPRRRHGPTCARLVKLGSFSHADRVGRNAVRFSGRLGRHRLPPGRYVLELTPQLAGQKGKTVSLRCRVL